MKDLHVALHDEMLSNLDALSRKLKTTRNLLIREALADFIARKKREAETEEMARYAAEMAPQSGEFVAEFKADVNRALWDHTEW
ncbi:MAG: ribbon-helix-helix protein, CopG family [Candidatus Xenobia bacterium]